MSLVSMAGIIGPTIFAGSFGYFVDEASALKLPGVPFLIAALLLTVALLVAYRVAPIGPTGHAAPAAPPSAPGTGAPT